MNEYGHAGFVQKTAAVIGCVSEVNPDYARVMVERAVEEFGEQIILFLKPELQEYARPYEEGKAAPPDDYSDKQNSRKFGQTLSITMNINSIPDHPAGKHLVNDGETGQAAYPSRKDRS